MFITRDNNIKTILATHDSTKKIFLQHLMIIIKVTFLQHVIQI